MSPGEEIEIIIRMLGLCFFTVTPWAFASAGSRAWAAVTRFWVSTLALSWSTPTLKLTSRSMRPSLVLDDCM